MHTNKQQNSTTISQKNMAQNKNKHGQYFRPVCRRRAYYRREEQGGLDVLCPSSERAPGRLGGVKKRSSECRWCFFLSVAPRDGLRRSLGAPSLLASSRGAQERVLLAGAERGLPAAAPRVAVGAAPHLLDEGADLRGLRPELLQLLLPGLHLRELPVRLVLHRLQRGLHLAESVGVPALGRRPLLLQRALRLQPRRLLALELLLRLPQDAQLLLHPRQLALHARRPRRGGAPPAQGPHHRVDQAARQVGRAHRQEHGGHVAAALDLDAGKLRGRRASLAPPLLAAGGSGRVPLRALLARGAAAQR